VLTIGRRLALPPDYEVLHLDDVSGIMAAVASFQPDVIVTSDFLPGALNKAAFEIRKKWIHVPPDAKPEAITAAVESCYAFNIWKPHPNAAANPLISVYTGTWNTGDYLRDTYESLREQTYGNWEWVCVDDFSTDGTWERLEALAKDDIRVRPFRSGKRLGKIGAVKDTATRLCRGEYLVELDHDDMLVDFALDEIKKAFESDPKVGMVYSNCSNFFEDGTFHRFDDAFWKDRYRWTEYRGKKWLECISPNAWGRFDSSPFGQWFTFLTVGPNHVRAFRRSFLQELGGYNANLPVSDDFDLFARAHLASVPPELDSMLVGWKCVHLDKLIYLYRVRDAWSNTTFKRNKSIQDHLALGRGNYQAEFASMNEKRLAAEGTAKPVDVVQIGPADVSFVVPEGAPTPLTIECLKSIRQWSPGSEIILVANGAEPLPEAATLADKIVRLEANLRFAAAVNRGAMEATRRLTCVFNNDARVVDAETPIRLAQYAERGAIAAPYSNRAKPPQGDIAREAVPKEDLFPDMVVGVCMMLPTELFRRLGGFDPRLYTWEDDDLCLRARRLGIRSVVVGGTWIEHERHATFKARGEDVQAIMVENRAIFERKHPRIRVLAIAKNEAAGIREYYEQFAPLTRDWCLLDTGSTDETVAIARSIGVRVESSGFEDFSQARNEAVRRFGAGADWIVMLDPDERLDAHTIRHVEETLFRTSHDIFMAPLQAVHADGRRRDFVPKPFLWRNKPEIGWRFKVHEKLVGSLRQALVVNAVIEHILSLHENGRRSEASALYDRLTKEEPYFIDPKYREELRAEWPILDYDRMDDPRIAKIHVGPLVSVVLPTYRRGTLLKKAVASALAQDYANLDMIVVGDACPDLDPSWFKNEPRVRVLNLPSNHGAGGAVPRNFGIMLAAGGLVAYLDDDNAWTPDHISSLYAALRAEGSAFAFSSMSVDGKDLLFSEPKAGGIDTSCVLHRKDLVAKHGWWKDRLEAATYAHDWEFFSRWVSAGEKWACTRRPTLLYNADTSGQKDFLKTLMARK
jgi:GT2 family glycosyltransferase